MKFIVVILFLFASLNDSARSQSPVDNDKTLLQDLLRQSREQNKKLEEQMNKMKLIWSGLQQMCSAFETPCDCKKNENVSERDESDETVSEKKIMTTMDEKEDIDNVRLILSNVASEGIQEDGSAKLSIAYRAGDNHVTDWQIAYFGDTYDLLNTYRTAGEKTIHGQDQYSTSLRVPNITKAFLVVCNFRSGSDKVSIYINRDIALNRTNQDVPSHEPYKVNLTYFEIAPFDEDLVISFEIVEHYSDSAFIGHAKLYFTGINTTVTPYKVFRTYQQLGKSWRRTTDNVSLLDITIPQRLTKLGGILTIQLPTKYTIRVNSLNPKLIDKILQGFHRYIRSRVTKEVIPKHAVGFFQMDDEVLVFKDEQTIQCTAYGNPRPTVKLFKHAAGGKRKLMKAETIVPTRLSQTVVYTIQTKEARLPKNFTCRAESGDVIVEQTILVKRSVPIQFDMDKTGLMKNTSEKMVFGCKASWEFNPDLSFRLYNEFGPDLAGGENITVVSKMIGSKTTRSTLTVSPRNDIIHTVFCIIEAQISERLDHRKIEVFPDSTPPRDWDLYKRLQGNATDYYYAYDYD